LFRDTRSGTSGGDAPIQRVAAIIAATMIALGVVLRLRAYASHFPLYIDEALLAQNLLTRSWSGLWAPLDLAQSAPPLFITLVKALGAAFGYAERVLRAIPFATGCLLLPLTWIVARQLLPNEESMVAVTLVALSPSAIFYSNMFKPYASDMIVTAAILGVTISALHTLTLRRVATLAAVGAIGILTSSTSVFILVGAGAALLVAAIRSRDRRTTAAVAVTGVLWVALLLFLRATAYSALVDQTTAAAKYMHDFWRQSFLFSQPDQWRASLRHAVSSLTDGSFVSLPDDESFGLGSLVILGLAIVGIGTLARTRGLSMLTLFVLPPILLASASIARQYPFAPRLVLFLAPLTAIAVGAGAGTLLRRVPPVARTLVVALAFVGPARTAAHLLRVPIDPAPSTAYADLQSSAASLARPDSTAVYVAGEGLPALLYYGFDRGPARDASAQRLLRLIDLEGAATMFRRMRDLTGPPPAAPDSVLAVHIRSRLVLVARPSGFRASRGRVRPEAGWADREAMRLAAAAPCTDVYLANIEAENDDLSTAIEKIGGVISNRRMLRVNYAFRACFPAGVPGTPRTTRAG
jgi:hypothetical protein